MKPFLPHGTSPCGLPWGLAMSGRVWRQLKIAQCVIFIEFDDLYRYPYQTSVVGPPDHTNCLSKVLRFNMRHKMEVVPQLGPYEAGVVELLQRIPTLTMETGPQQEVAMVPVAALRFTHHTVNSNLAFGEEHEHHQGSSFKLFLNLFQRQVELDDLEPLHAFLHQGPDGEKTLFSRNNRRLMWASCFLAVR